MLLLGTAHLQADGLEMNLELLSSSDWHLKWYVMEFRCEINAIFDGNPVWNAVGNLEKIVTVTTAILSYK